MRIPVIRGVIDRRILVNYRIDADVLGRLLPAPFRPHLVRGMGMAGICLIRLRSIRPRLFPSFLGVGSENAAHRIAVEWDRDGRTERGVYIPRRDTSSRLNSLAGGRLFPGVHQHARFQTAERDGRYRVVIDGDDGQLHLAVEATVATGLPDSSIFASLAEASAFFEAGSLGYSATGKLGEYDGLELRTDAWRVQPLAVQSVESSFFDDPALFPPGSATFDSALLMHDIPHEWHSRESICCGTPSDRAA